MDRKRKFAKIFSVIPFVLYGLLLFLTFLDWQAARLCYIFFALGWIPSIASAMAGIAFSILLLKGRRGKIFLALSCVHLVIGVIWAYWGILSMRPYKPEFY